MTATITVIGSVNLDIVASVERLPRPGETITGAELSRFPGGKGANQALAAQRLGARVRLVGRVGRDAAAADALALLRAGGVDLSDCLADADAATGIALISVARSGENHIVVAPGANRRLLSDAVHQDDTDALILQLEIPVETVAVAAERCSGFLCVNLAPARHVDAGVLARADLVVVNESEAAWYGSSLSACSGLIAKTHGERGAELLRDGHCVAQAEPPPVAVVDTTGAGDSFTAALTLALVEGREPDAALRFACAAGAAATMKMGAQPSLPTRDEVEALLQSPP